MKRVLLYHKQLTHILGGGTFQPLMFIAEMQKTCEVTLALNGDTDIKAVAKMSGIDIDTERLKIVRLDPKNKFIEHHEALASLLRQRKLKALAKDADICISTANVMDFGKSGHHFIYLLSQFGGAAFYDYLMQTKSRTGLRLKIRRIGTWLYEYMAKPLFGIRPLKRIINDQREQIYPTSKYVEGIVRGFFGDFNSKVFYPPTIFEFNEEKVVRDPLLAIYVGRIFPPKRLTDIIAIVERAREISGRDLKLNIAGKLAPIPYTDLLKKMAAERSWLKLIGPVYGKDKEHFMLSATYAIHAERDEAFGIAIAEYLKAGCVAIVPDVGGPTEIVDNEALTFAAVGQAAELLARLVCDDDFRSTQQKACAQRGKNFSLCAYIEREKAIIKEITRV